MANKAMMAMLKPLKPLAEQGLQKLIDNAKEIELHEGESAPAIMIFEKEETAFFSVVILDEEKTGYTRIIKQGSLSEFIDQLVS